MSGKTNHSGNVFFRPFSMVELLVIMAIIAILAGIGAGGYSVAQKWLAQSKTEALLAKLKIAIESYKNDKGYYPLPHNSLVNFSLDVNNKDYTSGTPGDCNKPINNFSSFIDYAAIQNGQSVKVSEGNWVRYYVKDGWNTGSDGEDFGVIRYECPGTVNTTSFDLYSAGPDRQFASDPTTDKEDDIYPE